MQIIQEPSPSRPGPHQAPGPRPEGNAIAMETAPAPSVAPFSGPAPRALQGRAPACSSFASPGEPRARASERESGYACALGTSPSGDPGRCRSLGQDAGRAGGGGSGFAGSPEWGGDPGGAGGTAPRPEAAAAAALVPTAASPAASVIPHQLLQTEDEEEEARNSHRPTEVSPGQSILHPLPASLPSCLPPILSVLPSLPLPSPPALILPNIPLSSPLLSPFQPFFHPFLLSPSPTSFPPFLSSLFFFQSLTLQLIFACLLSIFSSSLFPLP